MKTLATILSTVLLLSPAAALAQDYSPLQQYLYNESGYAPPQLGNQPVPQPEMNSPYDTAYAAPDAYEYEDSESEPVIMSLEDL